MRLIRKTLILALATFGAYRLYELLGPRAEEVRTRVTPQLNDTLENVKSVTTKVKGDVTGREGRCRG